MKKLLLLFFLVPFSVFAQFFSGTVTLNDGSTKTGLIELPNSSDQTIKFKLSQKEKIEKISINDVKNFQIKWQNDTIEYETMFLSEGKKDKENNFKVDKEKSWVQIEKRGKNLDLVSIRYSNSGVLGAAGQTSESGRVMYIKRHANNFAIYFFPIMESGGLTFQINFYKALMNSIKYHFENDCPKIIELTTKEQLKNKGLGLIVELHDEYCN